MADPSEINPKKLHSAGVEQSGLSGPEDGIYRLTRRPPEAREASDTDQVAKPELKARPDDRKPEARPSDEPPLVPAAADSVTPKKSLRRPLMFALLPLVLIVGGYFYVTGGAVMSTDNAYVQADMVGLSTDVSGIVREILVHDNQKVAKGDVLFKLDDLHFPLAPDPPDAQIANTPNNLIPLQTSYPNIQPHYGPPQKHA